MYNISQDSWSIAPEMNIKRYHHSSCGLDDMVYVVCGRYSSSVLLDSIERLNARLFINNPESGVRWEKLNIGPSELSAR